MPVKLSDLLKETATVEVQVGKSKVAITCLLMWDEAFSDEDWERIKGIRGRAYFKEVLPRLLTSWDLVDGRGKQIPVTAEAIDRNNIPIAFMRRCEDAALETQTLGKGNGKA